MWFGRLICTLLQQVCPEFIEFPRLAEHLANVFIFFGYRLLNLLLRILFLLTLTFAFAHLRANTNEVTDHEVGEAHFVELRRHNRR